MICALTRKQVFILFGLVLFGLLATGVGTALYLQNSIASYVEEYPPRGAAVSNSPECAVVARDIIYKGGSVVDAGIACAICEGAAMAQSMGIGGGFFATIYIKETGEVVTINARETAPKNATVDMFYGNPESSISGGLSVAVPGEVRGFQQLHQRYGKLEWKDLFQPTIKALRKGMLVNSYLGKLYKKNADFLKNTPGFSDFINPETLEPFGEGDRVKRLKLAETMEIIASEPDALNQGSLTKGFVEDVQNLGGIITEEDMNNYKPVWSEPIKMSLGGNLTLFTFPPPGAGVVLGHILGLVNESLEYDNFDKISNWQRILESFKFSYAMKTHLGDPLMVPGVMDFAKRMVSPELIAENKAKIKDDMTSQDPFYYGANTTIVEDHGTAHLNVLAPNGDAFTFTGTINLIFGAKVVSESTGIILNDEMDDFVTQPTNESGSVLAPANAIAPGKRPLSSMCPSIVLDADGNVRMLLGGAGGTKITTAAALVALRHLYFNQTVAEAIAAERMHHQLTPMEATYDPDIEPKLIEMLTDFGHVMRQESPDGFGAITAISNRTGQVHASSDTRRAGSAVHI